MKLKVLVVEDSRTVRHMLVSLINQSADMQVIGEGSDGSEALDLTTKLGPDVILMDVVMPKMDGLEATRQIMQTRPTPIVLISATLGSDETEIAFKAIKAGALTVLQKPSVSGGIFETNSLLSTVRAMAGVHVIHHWDNSQPYRTLPLKPVSQSKPQIVAIAASTGGPAALSEIIWHLPVNFSLPIVIVQHITADFVPSLVGWLNHVSKNKVQIARHGEAVLPGVIYVAPGDNHLFLSKRQTFIVGPSPKVMQFMPSADIMLESVAESYCEKAIGIVLTGMGDDGAHGLQAMRRAGAITIAQDEASSVVFGMPGEAIRLGAAHHVLPLSKIAPTLASLCS
ncbi:MAG: chemotaxis-specific protein-glutamate methyltransferase CheB [Anaerolineae bacterium]|nr:chemotaxis-specific protein-glutamate methyltransferase CheB [Anaerolineae bacterium]